MRFFPCLLLLVLGLNCHGQIQELSTTGSGDQLYFTSQLGVRGTESLPSAKIIRWTAGRGMEIASQRASQGDLGAGLSNPYKLSYPNVSGDGNLLTFAGYRDCYRIIFRLGCVLENPPQTTFMNQAGEIQADGRYQLSPNGMFALRTALPNGAPYTLLNFVTGTSNDLPRGVFVSDQGAVTNDGRVLYIAFGVLHLWSPDRDQQFGTSVGTISADGLFIILASTAAPKRPLSSIETATGNVVLFPLQGIRPTISNDGKFFTFLSPVENQTGFQLFISRPDFSDLWQITNEPEGVREALLSGDGNFVFILLESNQLWRYDVNVGSILEISPRIAYAYQNYYAGAQGATISISGKGLSDSIQLANYPLPSALGGLRIEADGIPLRIVSASPSTIVAQIPFEMSAGGRKELRIIGPDAALVAPPILLTVSTFAPTWSSAASNELALHGDLKTSVSFSAPAVAGEVIHFLLGGLGAVTPPLASGTLAPAEPELRVARQLQCILHGTRGETLNMEIVKAILLPGKINSYQVSVRVPDAKLMPADANGLFLATLTFEPADPLTGTFQLTLGQVPIRP